jgi:hypothetical protein
MSSDKKDILSKEAQEAQMSEQEIDKSTADKMANDILDKIFSEELAKLISSIN